MNDEELFKEFLAFKQFQQSQAGSEAPQRTKTEQRKSRTKKYKKRPDGRYYTTITSTEKDPDTGKPIKIFVYGNTIAELEENKSQMIIEKCRGTKLSKQKLTVKQFREQWYESKKVGIGHNTILMYDSIFANYFESIDEIPLSKVERSDLQLVINANRDKKRQCQKIRMVFNEVFNAAIDERIISYNPARKLEIPKYKAPEKRNLTDDEDELTETTEFTDRERAFLMIIKYFGLRKEEALALTKDDFNFKRDELHVRNAVIFIRNQPITKLTKNENPRIMPIMPNVRSFLMYYISNLEGYKLFVNMRNKEHMTEQGYKRMWASIISKMETEGKKTGKTIEDDLTAHIFRHNFAFILMYAGIDMKERQYLLGHSTIAMTMDIYTHIDTTKMKASSRLKKYADQYLLKASDEVKS